MSNSHLNGKGGCSSLEQKLILPRVDGFNPAAEGQGAELVEHLAGSCNSRTHEHSWQS